MKTFPLSLLITATFGAGAGMGWLLRGHGSENNTSVRGHVLKAVEPAPAGGGSRRTPGKGAAEEAMAQTETLASQELERLAGLSVQEFGTEMAETWLSSKADTHLRKALFLSVCDAERAMAFWKEHSRRQGLKLEENAKIPDFLQAVSFRDGKRLMELAREAMPGGPFNGIAHGWAAAEPEEAVNWLNALPDKTPGYDSALQGVLWGLAERSPATALFAYERLSPNDQNYHTALNVSMSTLKNHGMEGLAELANGVKDPAQRQLLLTSALSVNKNQPPAEFVKWMAGPLETAPYLSGTFDQMASRWVAEAPDEAIAWLQQNARRTGEDAALTTVAAKLAQSTKSGDLAAWLAANPGVAGRDAILRGTETAR